MAEKRTPEAATQKIRDLAKELLLNLTFTEHAKKQMQSRDIIEGDVLYILKNGFVYRDPEESTRKGFYKYSIESRAPNSRRTIKLIIIPDEKTPAIKIVTCMWKDCS